MRVLQTALAPDQHMQIDRLYSKLGAALTAALSSTLPKVLVTGRAGSLTCKAARVLSAAPLPGLVQHRQSHIAECQHAFN